MSDFRAEWRRAVSACIRRADPFHKVPRTVKKASFYDKTTAEGPHSRGRQAGRAVGGAVEGVHFIRINPPQGLYLFIQKSEG